MVITAPAVFGLLTLDSIFKNTFVNEQYLETLLFLLNTFLKRVLKKPITNVKIINTVQTAKSKNGRGAIFDMQCEDASGARFIVEMQVSEQDYFIKRTFFYLCLAVSNLAKKGKSESKKKKIPYDFNIPVVYTLSFLNFDLDFGEGCEDIVQHLYVTNAQNPNIHYDIMNMVYVRLTKFDKKAEECKTDLDKLLFTFKNAHKLDKKSKIFDKSIFNRIYELAKISNLSTEDYMKYQRELMHYSDYVNTIAFADRKGEARGMQKVFALLEQGMSLTQAKRKLGVE